MKQFATLSLVHPAPLQAHFHRMQFHLGDNPLQAQNETIIGILGIEHSIFVGDQCIEDRADLKQIVPIFGVPGQTAHLQSENNAELLIGHQL